MPPLIKAKHAWPIARGIRAAPSRHARKHTSCGGQPLRIHPVVPLYVTPRDWLRLPPVGQDVPITEHHPRARGRIVSLGHLHAGVQGARVAGRKRRRVVKAPAASWGTNTEHGVSWPAWGRVTWDRVTWRRVTWGRVTCGRVSCGVESRGLSPRAVIRREGVLPVKPQGTIASMVFGRAVAR